MHPPFHDPSTNPIPHSFGSFGGGRKKIQQRYESARKAHIIKARRRE